MTAARSDISDLPDWPRLLSWHQAAAYVGLSPTTFMVQVRLGTYPDAINVGRRVQWDRRTLDLAVDGLSGKVDRAPSEKLEEVQWGKSP